MEAIMQNCVPLVSIVIPIYKTQAFLGQCIESVLSQTYHNLEIILVDDAHNYVIVTPLKIIGLR